MKIIAILFLLLFTIKPFGYAKYNWKKKNKLGAVGAIFVAVAAVIFPAVLIMIR